MDIAAQRQSLLAWYRRTARELPWPAAGPWRVMVSEFMLQQTQVKTVLPRYEPFMQRFPSPDAMVRAGEEAVISAWAGLGYYRRARALFAAAEAVVARHEGVVPGDLEALRALPGVGAYTSAAIASIGFELPAAVVDGNVERVLARLRAFDEPVRPAAGRRAVQRLADDFLNAAAPGDHNQAMMELGARVCRPQRADCLLCPLQAACQGQHDWRSLPVLRERKKTVPEQLERRLLLIDPRGHTVWRRRPADGLYANLPDLPSLDEGEKAENFGDVVCFEETTQRLSHRLLRVQVWRVDVPSLPEGALRGSVRALLADERRPRGSAGSTASEPRGIARGGQPLSGDKTLTTQRGMHPG